MYFSRREHSHEKHSRKLALIVAVYIFALLASIMVGQGSQAKSSLGTQSPVRTAL